jgi:uncharacterized protein (DUF488 family)
VPSPPLLTVGHGTLAAEDLSALLVGAGVELLVDVRAYPGSRRHPWMARAEMAQWVPDAGVAYRWDGRLGGRRRASPESPHVALRVPAFRAYADHMGTAEFAGALDDLMDDVRARRTAVLCSETLWWRCHRRLISDAAVLRRDTPVLHLAHDGGLAPHVVTDAARLADPPTDLVVYDVGAPGSLPLEG